MKYQDECEKKANSVIVKYDKMDNSTCRILVVEDSPLNMEITIDTLQRAGYETEEAVNGKQAVEMVEQSGDGYYDFVLMDIQMPVMDGLTAVKQMRNSQREYVKNLMVIAMSAYAQEEDILKSIHCGMSGHLLKPVRIESLEKELGNR